MADAPEHSFEITQGKMIRLSGLLPQGIDDGTIAWATSNDHIAEVDDSGLVTGWNIGSCKITAFYTDEAGSWQAVEFAVRVTSRLLENRSRSITITLPPGHQVDVVGMFYPTYTGAALRNIQCNTTGSTVIALQGSTVTAKQAGSCYVSIDVKDGFEVSSTQRIRVVVQE